VPPTYNLLSSILSKNSDSNRLICLTKQLYPCSEDVLQNILGGMDALSVFQESDEKGYLEY
jgi:hypothetical protein